MTSPTRATHTIKSRSRSSEATWKSSSSLSPSLSVSVVQSRHVSPLYHPPQTLLTCHHDSQAALARSLYNDAHHEVHISLSRFSPRSLHHPAVLDNNQEPALSKHLGASASFTGSTWRSLYTSSPSWASCHNQSVYFSRRDCLITADRAPPSASSAHRRITVREGVPTRVRGTSA
jgi:hypothetical protein